MINTNYGAGGMRPLEPTAAKLAQGVHGGNIEDVTSSLAQDSATVMHALDKPVKTELASDVQALKTQLWARLADHQMGTALMTAGAIMGGPQGVVLQDLQGTLKSTLASPERLDQLAEKITKFNEPVEGEAKPPRADVYQSMGTHVTRELAQQQLGGQNVPAATFIAGALANAYQDQGGYNIAP
jgi:hypothetical protein